MSSPCRPSVPLIASSLVVLTGSLFLLANSLAALTVTWDGLTMVGGMILMPLALAMVIQQYRATFLRCEKAARFTALMLAILGAFATLFCVGTFAEFRSEEYQIPWLLFATLLALAVFGFLSARSNFRWAMQLHQNAEEVPIRLRPHLAAGTVAVLMTGLMTVYLIGELPPRYAEHVEYDSPPFGIPSQATDICFCQGSRGTIAYEFAIDEQGFRQWFDAGIGTIESLADDLPLLKIDDPITIIRYCRLASELSGADSATIDRGLYYHWSREDRSVEAVFDSGAGRAYYYHSAY